MPEKQKVYCGLKQQLPDGYTRFANRFQCLKKGYGACLYAGRMGTGVDRFNGWTYRVGFMLLWVLLILVVMLWMIWFLRGN